MKFMRQPFDMRADGLHPASSPSRPNLTEPRRPARPLAVLAWDPTAKAKRLLWIGLMGMLLCALVFSGLNAISAQSQYTDLGVLVILTYLLFSFAGLASAWTFLKGAWGYLFPAIQR